MARRVFELHDVLLLARSMERLAQHCEFCVVKAARREFCAVKTRGLMTLNRA
jgi:hypothetical protein